MPNSNDLRGFRIVMITILEKTYFQIQLVQTVTKNC